MPCPRGPDRALPESIGTPTVKAGSHPGQNRAMRPRNCPNFQPLPHDHPTCKANTVKPPQNVRHHVQRILALGIPLAGSHLAQMSIGITDTLMLGWYDVEVLAAQVLAGSFFFVIFILGSGFGIAVTPMVANAAGAGDTTQARRVTRMGMWLSLAFALLVLPLFWHSGAILMRMGQTPEVSALGQTYLMIAGFSMFPGLQVMVLKGYLSALERTSFVFWATVGSAVANAFANWLLIFGNWGFPEMGIAGAAIASVLTNCLGCIALLIYAHRAEPENALMQRIWRPDWSAFRQVFQLGVPIGLTLVAEVGLFATSAVMVGWVGTRELAAHGIALQLASITFMIHLGLGGVATIRAGRAQGAGDVDSLRDGSIIVMAMSIAFSIFTICLFLLFPEPLIGLFLDPDDPERGAIVAIGVTLLALAALFQLADGAQAIAISLLRGLQDARVPLLLAAVSYWLVGVPVCYILSQPLGLGAPGVWIGLTFGLATAAVLLNVRYWRNLPTLSRMP